MAKPNQKSSTETKAPEAAPVETVKPQFELPKLMEQYKTKSSVIRFLAGQGWTRSQIATFMNIRYQHVRNVLIQPLVQKVETPKVETPVEEVQ